MRLTPLDIRKQEFGTGLRGYDVGEVQAFLQMVADQWQEQVEERRRLEERLRDAKAKLQHYERVEEALQEALQTSRENKQKAIENAEREAKVLVKEAQAHAREVKQEAKEERDRLRREATQLGERRNEVAARLRAFLTSELELLRHFDAERDGAQDTSRLHPAPEEAAEEEPHAARDEDAAWDAPEKHREEQASVGAVPEEEAAEAVSESPGAQPEEELREEAQPEEELPDYLERFSEEDEVIPLEQQNAAGAPEWFPEETADERKQGGGPGAGWSVNALFASKRASSPKNTPPRPAPPEEEGREETSSQEMDKIRRILDDMD